jgi:hypothetical protein
MYNRTNLNHCLSKAIAYHECGKPEAADVWAQRLVRMLNDAGILLEDGKAEVTA